MTPSITQNPLAGIWQNNQHTTIEILEKRNGNLVIFGETLWGTDRKYGPNIGDFSGIIYKDDNQKPILEVNDGACTVKIFVRTNKTLYLEDNSQCGGMNARFYGEVKKQNKYLLF